MAGRGRDHFFQPANSAEILERPDMGTRAVKRATWMAGLLTAAALTGTQRSRIRALRRIGEHDRRDAGANGAWRRSAFNASGWGKTRCRSHRACGEYSAASPAAAVQPGPEARPSEAGVQTGTAQSEPTKPESATAAQPEEAKPEAAKQDAAADAAKPDASKPDASKEAATAPANVRRRMPPPRRLQAPAAPDAAKPAASAETPAAGTPPAAAAAARSSGRCRCRDGA